MAPRARTLPRKKAVQERSKATVDAILGATARVLVKVGYDHASTNRIAEAAGVSVGSLYQYFPSKEALVAALIERHMDEMTAVVTSAMERVMRADLESAARDLVRVMIAAHAVDPGLHRVLVEQIPRIGRLERVNDVERHVTALARAWITANADSLRPVDPDVAAYVVVVTIEALTHAAVLSRHDLLQSGKLEAEIVEIVVRYLRR